MYIYWTSVCIRTKETSRPRVKEFTDRKKAIDFYWKLQKLRQDGGTYQGGGVRAVTCYPLDLIPY